MNQNELFTNIAGYKTIKDELNLIRGWFLDESIINNPNITLPKGIIFYGRPGNGKTLFVKEYSESFNVPLFEIKGDASNTCEEIEHIFEEAKKNTFSIIIIDEIDLLISGSMRIERTLQTLLDGIDKKGNVLILATTNFYKNLSAALLRSGRFDRSIFITDPNKESRKEIFSLYLDRLGIKGNFDLDYISTITDGVSCADITAIINDAYLRCNHNISTEELEISYHRVYEDDYSPCLFDKNKVNLEIAYHEVAHSLLVNKYKDSFIFFKAYFNNDCLGGKTRYFPIKEDWTSVDDYIKAIDISLAGYAMTKLKFHHLDSGSLEDLQIARQNAVRLVNKCGYNGPEVILPFYSNNERMETEKRKSKNERIIERIIKQRYRKVRSYLKKNLKKADTLSSIMMTKGYIDSSDMKIVY